MRELVYTFYINDPDSESGIFGCVARSEEEAENLARMMGYRDFFLAGTRELETHESASAIDSSIRANPFVGEKWLGVIEAIEVLIDERTFSRINPTWTMQTYGHFYSLSPNTSPYVQAILESDGSLHVELSGNIICVPPLAENQMQQLEWIGWSRPSDENPQVPNFVRIFEPGWHARFVAERIVESLTSIMRIQEDDFFNFSENPTTIAAITKIALLDQLMPDADRNPNGSIFCLAGQHDDLLAEKKTISVAAALRELLQPELFAASRLETSDLVVVEAEAGEIFLQVFPWTSDDQAVNVYTRVANTVDKLHEFRVDLSNCYRDEVIDLDPLVGRWSASDDGQIWFNVHLPLIAAKAQDVLDTTVRYIVETVTKLQPAIIARYGGKDARFLKKES